MSDHDRQLSQARLNANRQNAQHSTGPKTLAGKAIGSQNAVKTALTGAAVLLPIDDADRYAAHIESFRVEFAPIGRCETILTQSLADIAWRLERIVGLEMAIYAKGRALFAGSYAEEPAALRPQLIELDIYEANERALRNLQIQEARLCRQRAKDTAELRFLQATRRHSVDLELELAAQAYRQAKAQQKPFNPSDLGFVFATTDIERFLDLRRAEQSLLAAHRPPPTTPAIGKGAMASSA